MALRDEGYQARVAGGGDLEYVYVHTQESRSFHPIVEAHRKMAERLLHVQAELDRKMLDPHYRVKLIVFRAIMGEKDVRGTTNPKMMEEIMDIMDVNPQDEPYLIPRIKLNIEDCYFRMRE